jgi:N-acetyl-gamma-glutamyl-phosphate reductase
VTYLGARDSGRTLEAVHPHLAGLGMSAPTVIEAIDAAAVADRAEFALCALPPGASVALVPPLADAGVRVIDLSGGFRCSPS